MSSKIAPTNIPQIKQFYAELQKNSEDERYEAVLKLLPLLPNVEDSAPFFRRAWGSYSATLYSNLKKYIELSPPLFDSEKPEFIEAKVASIAQNVYTKMLKESESRLSETCHLKETLRLKQMYLLPDAIEDFKELKTLDLSDVSIQITKLPKSLFKQIKLPDSFFINSKRPMTLIINERLVPWIQKNSLLLDPEATIELRSSFVGDAPKTLGLFSLQKASDSTSSVYKFSEELKKELEKVLPFIQAVTDQSEIARQVLTKYSDKPIEEQIAHFFGSKEFLDLECLDLSDIQIPPQAWPLLETFVNLHTLRLLWDRPISEISSFVGNFSRMTSLNFLFSRNYFIDYLGCSSNYFPKNFDSPSLKQVDVSVYLIYHSIKFESTKVQEQIAPILKESPSSTDSSTLKVQEQTTPVLKESLSSTDSSTLKVQEQITPVLESPSSTDSNSSIHFPSNNSKKSFIRKIFDGGWNFLKRIFLFPIQLFKGLFFKN